MFITLAYFFVFWSWCVQIGSVNLTLENNKKGCDEMKTKGRLKKGIWILSSVATLSLVVAWMKQH
jgi:hypothetical protein